MFDPAGELRHAPVVWGEAGFTLTELLIAIVVLGVLAAVVVFGLSGVTGQSAQAACNADAKSVELAVESYHTMHQAWPTAAQLTTPDAANGNTQYLRTFPAATHYLISLSGGANPSGEVDVILPASGNTGPPWQATATGFDQGPNLNPCSAVT